MNEHEKRHNAVVNSNKKVPLMRIIRLKCLECCCFNDSEVRKCPCDDCILHKYRMGRNPFPKKISEKQKENIKKLNKKAQEGKR